MVDKLPWDKLIVYCPVAQGGTYYYAQQWVKAYQEEYPNQELVCLLPENADWDAPFAKRILMADEPDTSKPLFRKLHFLFRVFINPLRLWAFARKEKQGAILFNDFEQLSAFFWVPLFRLFLNRTPKAILLHDPDRDAYPPNQSITQWSMRQIMAQMDLGVYHEILPQKPYYQQTAQRYANVGHGLFPQHAPDAELYDELQQFKGKDTLLSIPGNLREEKNYELVLQVLRDFPGIRLVVAGKKAHSGVPLEQWLRYAEEQLTGRVLWKTHYLSHAEFAAVLEVSDAVLLYYSSSFKSQSGILFKAGAHRKPLIVSKGEHALSHLVERYGLGMTVPQDDPDALHQALDAWLKQAEPISADWEGFSSFSDWHTNVRTVVDTWRKAIAS